MKTLLITLMLVIAPSIMFGQINANTFSSDGVAIHYIADAWESAADSMHFMGTYTMVDGGGAIYDSLNMVLFAEDSLNATLYCVLRHPLKATYVAGTVPTDTLFVRKVGGFGFIQPVATGTAGGQLFYQWTPSLIPATVNLGSYAVDVWVRVHAVGSEVASSSKRFGVLVEGFRKRR